MAHVLWGTNKTSKMVQQGKHLSLKLSKLSLTPSRQKERTNSTRATQHTQPYTYHPQTHKNNKLF